MFKRDDFNIIDASEVPKGGTVVRGWDLAATDATQVDAKKAAWTVGLKVRYVKRKIYIEDVIRFRGSPHKVRTKMRTAAAQDGKVVKIDFPQDPGQAGKAQAEDIAADFPRYRIYYSPESGDNRPIRCFNSTLLPTPLRPMIAVTRPCSIVRSTPSRTVSSAKALRISFW